MVINTNNQALAATTNLRTSQQMLAKSLDRLSSGSKIVSPADDAAGVAVAARLDSQIRRTDAARTNVINAISFTQTQDGYMKKIANALDRMSELSTLALDVTKSDADRSLYQAEFLQLQAYIGNAAGKDFNGVPLFTTLPLDVTIDADGNKFSMAGIDLTVTAYTDALANTTKIDTAADADTALGFLKTAINQLSSDRASIGASQSRLNFTADQLSISKENLAAATSRIKDVDVAEESTQFARYNILVQSGTAMLAQANALPQSVLRLLQ